MLTIFFLNKFESIYNLNILSAVNKMIIITSILVVLSIPCATINGFGNNYDVYMGNDLKFSFDYPYEFLHLARTDLPISHWFFSGYKTDGSVARVRLTEAIPSDSGNYTYYGKFNFTHNFHLDVSTGKCTNEIQSDDNLYKLSCITSKQLRYMWIINGKLLDYSIDDYSIQNTISYDVSNDQKVYELLIRFNFDDTNKNYTINMKTRYFSTHYITNVVTVV
jgi:hypothetical protein